MGKPLIVIIPRRRLLNERLKQGQRRQELQKQQGFHFSALNPIERSFKFSL